MPTRPRGLARPQGLSCAGAVARITSILANPVEEAQRVLAAAADHHVTLRLVGGVAVFFRCPSASAPELRRTYVDIDFVGHANQVRALKGLFTDLGYVPREMFNRVQGDRRLIFNDLEHQRRVDIFLDVFEMCHKFSFKERLDLDPQTLSLADLLVTKLQIVEMNTKDVRDIVSLLLDHEFEDRDGHGINAAYLAGLAARDWGVYKTFTMSLDKVGTRLPEIGLDGPRTERVRGQLATLRRALDDAPKSARWKLRSAVGPSVRWYELPEADKEVVDSRIG